MGQPATTVTAVPDNLARLRNDHALPLATPASLHEDAFAAPGYEDNEFVTAAKDSLQVGRQAAEHALELARAVLADESQTLFARHALAQDRVRAATKSAIARLQNTVQRLDDKVAAVGNFLQGPKPDTSALTAYQMSECRRALAVLPATKRRAAVLAAIEAGDLTVARAVTRVQPFLLGPDADNMELEAYREAWARTFHADVVEMLGVLRNAHEHATRGLNLLVSFTDKLASGQIAAEARRMQARSADAARAAGLE